MVIYEHSDSRVERLQTHLKGGEIIGPKIQCCNSESSSVWNRIVINNHS